MGFASKAKGLRQSQCGLRQSRSGWRQSRTEQCLVERQRRSLILAQGCFNPGELIGVHIQLCKSWRTPLALSISRSGHPGLKQPWAAISERRWRSTKHCSVRLWRKPLRLWRKPHWLLCKPHWLLCKPLRLWRKPFGFDAKPILAFHSAYCLAQAPTA
jgi:hypothetical protein